MLALHATAPELHNASAQCLSCSIILGRCLEESVLRATLHMHDLISRHASTSAIQPRRPVLLIKAKSTAGTLLEASTFHARPSAMPHSRQVQM